MKTVRLILALRLAIFSVLWNLNFAKEIEIIEEISPDIQSINEEYNHENNESEEQFSTVIQDEKWEEIITQLLEPQTLYEEYNTKDEESIKEISLIDNFIWDIQQESNNPRIIISEVYRLWNDEWIELTNLSDEDFEWKLTIQWVKSSDYNLNIKISAYNSVIISDKQEIWLINDKFLIITWAWLNFNDSNALNIYLIFSWNEIDSFEVNAETVSENKVDSKYIRPSFQKIYNNCRETEITTEDDTRNITWFKANPGSITIRSWTPRIWNWPENDDNKDDENDWENDDENFENSNFDLMISEVFYDWDDERIEIYNIWSGSFYGDIELFWEIFWDEKISQIYSNIQIPAEDFLIIADSDLMFDFSENINWNVNILVNSWNYSEFSILENQHLNIDLLLSWEVVDSFFAHKYRVEKRAEYWVSFHKILKNNWPIVTRAYSNDDVNLSEYAQDNYLSANPWVLYTNADNIVNYAIDPNEEEYNNPDDENDETPISCDEIEDDLIKIDEIFRWWDRYEPYIEFDLYEDLEYEFDSIYLSGSLLNQPLLIDLYEENETYDMEKLQKNTKLILTTKAWELSEAWLITIIYHPDFKFNNYSWALELYGLNGQTRQLLDIVKINTWATEKSTYHKGYANHCWDGMDNVMNFSPWFDESALKYFSTTSSWNIKTVETVKYVWWWGWCSCPSKAELCKEFITETWNSQTWNNLIQNDDKQSNSEVISWSENIPLNSIKIISLESKNPESITLQSFLSYDIDFTKHIYYLKTSTAKNKKYIDGILSANSVDTFSKTFWFVDSWSCVYLYSWDVILDNYCYSEEKEEKIDKEKKSEEEKTEYFNPSDYQISISYIDYDPEWSDTWKEKITIESNSEKALDLAKIKMKVNSTNKKLNWILEPYSSITLEWTFWFPNSTKDWSDVIIQLFTWDYIFTTYTYNPNKTKIEEEIKEESELTGKNNNELIIEKFPDVKIKSILPNPSWKDSEKEEISLLRTPSEDFPEYLNILDLSPDFSLLINSKTKKKLVWNLTPNQIITIKWSFSFPNSASCISLLYSWVEIDTFCYWKAWDWVKFNSDNTSVHEISTEELDIVKKITLVKKNDQLCISYNKTIFSCKKIPNSTTEKNTKLISMQNNYILALENYLKSDYSLLYYQSDLKDYFDLYSMAKKSIKAWENTISWNWLNISATDINTLFSNFYEQDAQTYFINKITDIIPENISSALLQFKDKYYASQIQKGDLSFLTLNS